MYMETIKGHSDQSVQYDQFDLAWSMEGATKQVANVRHTNQMINLIDVSTYH